MIAFAAAVCLLAAEPTRDAGEVVIQPGVADADGVIVHSVTSPFQAGTTRIKVLLPPATESPPPWQTLFLLPVEALDGRVWGDPLADVRKHGLHVRHGLLCVVPTFSHLPWYADHPTDPEIRQERYFLEVVLPFVERTYGSRLATGADPSSRLLVGFSKSGWGAFSLMLRHPDLFGRAAAWDAPLLQAQPNQFGMGPIFGTTENFRRYQLSRRLEDAAEPFKNSPRLIHIGYGNFRDHHQRLERLLVDHGLQHVYQDGPYRKHHWNSGWLAGAVELLMRADGSATVHRVP